MLGFQAASQPDPLTTVALVGLAVVLWIFARVEILRRQLRHAGEERGMTRLRFLHHLAAWGGTHALLALLALGCTALLVWRAL